jgi:SPP1 gp7 family putative phage head morphogenesis protein
MTVQRIPVVKPEEALRFFREKGLTKSFAWQDVWQEEHAKAFTVAKSAGFDILEDIRAALDKAIDDGTTLADFRRGLQPLLEKKGWWGRRTLRDPLTGELVDAQLGSARRLRTIFEVNLRSAYAAGRWERLQRNKKGFPFLRYVTVGDSRVRPEHQAWDGVIRPIDDPWWETHYPPCGWNCRCTTQPVSRGMMERRGWEVTDSPPQFPVSPYVNPRSGEVSRIEEGIDPGFSFNVGRAYLDTLTTRPIATGETTAIDAKAADAFLGALGVDVQAPEAEQRRVIFDRGGFPLAIGPAWIRSAGGKRVAPGRVIEGDDARPLLRDVGRSIIEPDMIRTAWVQSANGEQLLARRYIRIVGDRAAMVEISRAGWRFEPMSAQAALKVARDGHHAWSPPAGGLIERYVDEALRGKAQQLPMQPLGRLPSRLATALGKLGVKADDHVLAIDASNLAHALARHGNDRDPARALQPGDLRKAERILLAASDISRGDPFVTRRGTRFHFRAEVDGVAYVGALEVRSRAVVIQTLRRR